MHEVTGLGTLAGIFSPTRRPFSYVAKSDNWEEDGSADLRLRGKRGNISLSMKGQTNTQPRELL